MSNDTIDRRTFLLGTAAAAAPLMTSAGECRQWRRIAVEEAFSFRQHAQALEGTARSNDDSLDVEFLRKLYAQPRARMFEDMHRRLLDLEEERLKIMDRDGVAMQVLSLTSPGVQMFAPAVAVDMARVANDILVDVIKRHPRRFAGLASISTQDVEAAVKEMRHSIERGLHGFIINSHTDDKYLDEPEFFPILKTAEELRAPIYLHPRSPSKGMAGPFRKYGLSGASWGYQVETGTHALLILMSGVLDRAPGLTLILGHMGEGIPPVLWRIDNISESYRKQAGLKLKASEYFQRNFMVTTSGVEDHVTLRACVDRLGADRVMWAIDYPYGSSETATHFMNTAPISDTDKEMVFYANAERVFRINVSSAH